MTKSLRRDATGVTLMPYDRAMLYQKIQDDLGGVAKWCPHYYNR